MNRKTISQDASRRPHDDEAYILMIERDASNIISLFPMSIRDTANMTYTLSSQIAFYFVISVHSPSKYRYKYLGEHFSFVSHQMTTHILQLMLVFIIQLSNPPYPLEFHEVQLTLSKPPSICW